MRSATTAPRWALACVSFLSLSFAGLFGGDFGSAASAQPVRGTDAEVLWVEPQAGALLDVAAGSSRAVGMGWPRRLPERGFLTAQLRAGEPVWVHIDGDPQAVRFAFLSGGADGAATIDATPESRGRGDFVLTAPLGPPTWLGLSVRPGHTPPRAQVWIGTIKSPGYRWELWEELAKRWSGHSEQPQPAPPELAGQPLFERLAQLADAVRLAQSESPPADAARVKALLQAAALLASMPAREPLFPYFRRAELTGQLGSARPQQKIEGLRMAEVKDRESVRLTVDGPAILRIEARTRFEPTDPFHTAPLQLQLRNGSRLLAVAAEEVAPHQEPESKQFSSQRRVLIAAAPGRHTYELRVGGAAAWVSVITHKRVVHIDDAANRSEDVAKLLRRALEKSQPGVLGTLLAAEASFLSLEDDKAAAGFREVASSARNPRLRAFALLRLAALAPEVNEADRLTQQALKDLGEATDAETARARDVLVADQLIRIVAATEPGAAPGPEAVALLRRTPGALPYMVESVGSLLRHVPAHRALALPLLAAAQQRSPLDVSLRHALSREWFTGSRWSALPTLELWGAERVELLMPPRESITCAEAEASAIPAYVPLRGNEVSLQVPDRLAPEKSLRRYPLFALREGAPRLGWAELALDGTATRVPLLWQTERLPIALAAGRHTLRASIEHGKDGLLLAPCDLLPRSDERALRIEHRYSALRGRGAQARAVLLEPGTPGFVGLELRASPALRSGRLLVRTDQGVLGTIEVRGHGHDPEIIKAGGEPMGPPLLVVLRVPATARVLEVTREDDGAALLISARLRRSLVAPAGIEPVTPSAPSKPELLERLRLATRALRAAKDPAARADARLRRAEVLIGLDARMMARGDLEQALPALFEQNNEAALGRARSLLATTREPPLLPRRPGTAGAVVLAAGVGVGATEAEASCVGAALARFASDAAAGRRAAAACAGVIAEYAAARFEEAGGQSEAASSHYAAAYLRSRAGAEERGLPALAREAALRIAERGPGRGSRQAMALAAVADQDEDPEGGRALDRMQGLVHLSTVRGADVGMDARALEPSAAPLSLRAALADVPWDLGLFQELRPGKSAETDLQLQRPLRVHVEAFCDDSGQVPPSGPPCGLSVEIDGAAIAPAPAPLRAGERARLVDTELGRGAHRIKVLLPRRDAARAFVHVTTDRPLAGDQARPEGNRSFGLQVTAPVLRFLGTSEQPVQLRAQGATALRVDALIAPGAGPRSLGIELLMEGRAAVRRAYPVCSRPPDPTAPKVPPAQKDFDCRAIILVPLLAEGTYRIKLSPSGAPRMSLALSLHEDEPSPSPESAVAQSASPSTEEAPPATANPALAGVPRPESSIARALGTLQVQEQGVFGAYGRDNPQVGDTYGETSIFYRRRLEGLPIWLKAGALLRLRNGPASYGGQAMIFARIPLLELRVFTQLSAFTQSVNGQQEVGVDLNSYLERSFAIVPHLFVLPRFAFTANYQSLNARPPLPMMGDPNAPMQITPIDLSVFNLYDAAHPTGIYGQVMVWGVPFVNMITYGMVRLTSNRSVHMLDAVTGRFGIDFALRTTEVVAEYEIAKYLVNDARQKSLLQNRIGLELKQTIWLNRNHRLGLQASGNVEASSLASTFTIGAFWEGSRGRGLDDYATPEINLPQQIGQGRGYLRPEETLR